MSPGGVILSRLQQSDGRMKTRPAVVLARVPPYNDLLICAVSSKIRHEVPGFDELVLTTDPDFSTSGLKTDSLIRLGLIATIPASAVIGELGALAPERLTRLLRNLSVYLTPAAPTTDPRPPAL